MAALIAVMAGTAQSPPALAAKPDPRAVPTSGTAARIFGIATPGLPWETADRDRITSRLPVQPDQLTFYESWSTPDFPVAQVRSMAAAGAVPDMVWMPMDANGPAHQPAYAPKRIIRGRYDKEIRRWAREIKRYAAPLVIRFAPEMNGNWLPWGVEEATPRQYVAMWRHVVRIFRAVRVRNVTWTWAPDVLDYQPLRARRFFPGDRWVDRVGLDGYNSGTDSSTTNWRSFARIFRQPVRFLRRLSNRPIYVEETASTELGGDKAAWIAGMWSWLAKHPEVRGLTWFDFDKETDWRIDSSAASFDAFTAGLRGFVSGSLS
jgi:hypothetical protein